MPSFRKNTPAKYTKIEEGFLPGGSELANWWSRSYNDSSSVIESKAISQINKGNHGSAFLLAMLQATMDFGSDSVDLLRIGEGVKKGGLKGIGQDALRLWFLVPGISKVVKPGSKSAVRAVTYVNNITKPYSRKVIKQISSARFYKRIARKKVYKWARGIVYEPRTWQTARKHRNKKLVSHKGNEWTWEHLFIPQRVIDNTSSKFIKGIGNSYLNTFLRVRRSTNSKLYHDKNLHRTLQETILYGIPLEARASYGIGEWINDEYLGSSR